jgi:hypothetical protein
MAARRKALPNTGANRSEEKELQQEVNSVIISLAEDTHQKAAKNCSTQVKMNPVTNLLSEVMKGLSPALRPHETAADRKRLDAALTRAVASLRSAAACKPRLAVLKTKMIAVAAAAPASMEHRCAYAEALADALREVKADDPSEPEALARKYLKKAGGGGGGGGGGEEEEEEEDIVIQAGSMKDQQAKFKCPISLAPMKQPMKKWVRAALPRLRAPAQLTTPPFSQHHLRPHVRQRQHHGRPQREVRHGLP